MSVTVLHGDCRDVLATLPDQSVNCCVTSPLYFGLRGYGVSGQIGLEATPDAFVAELVARGIQNIPHWPRFSWRLIARSLTTSRRAAHTWADRGTPPRSGRPLFSHALIFSSTAATALERVSARTGRWASALARLAERISP